MSDSTGDDGRGRGERSGHSLEQREAETDRLIGQAAFYGPFTWRLLRAAELTGGMRVLTVGRPTP